jgi:hypothetical protein
MAEIEGPTDPILGERTLPNDPIDVEVRATSTPWPGLLVGVGRVHPGFVTVGC